MSNPYSRTRRAQRRRETSQPDDTSHAIERVKELEADYDRLRDALTSVIGEVDDLIGESSGVYGLHLNGDPSPWGEVVAGGRFERLGALEEARAALAQEQGEHNELN